MKKIFLFRFCLLCMSLLSTLNSKAQDTKPIATFHITQASKNGVDFTQWCFDRKQYFAFYFCDKSRLCMANVSGINSDQSYGGMFIDKPIKTFPETSKSYRMDEYIFRWNYVNTYDDKEGWATILFDKIYKPQGVSFKMVMTLANLDVAVYEGYMDGTLDFSQFF